MKFVGLITEYNPFHNGHRYHIQKALEVSGADAAIVVMSGDYVQRGEPAVLPNRLRAEMALRCGAAAVFELPLCYATGSAELFAFGAVSLLDKLGIIDSICFGCECDNLDTLSLIADILSSEPPQYRQILKDELKKGRTFPAARVQALSACLPAGSRPDLADVLSEPNNILGIEYLKALKKLGSSIKPFAIHREGAAYHDTRLHASRISSASSIRRHLAADAHEEVTELIAAHTPPCCHSLYRNNWGTAYPMETGDFSLLLKYRLLETKQQNLTQYQDVSKELSNRIAGQISSYTGYDSFIDCLTTKELTRSRIQRALLHILLNVTAEDTQTFLENGVHFYAHLLGFQKKYAGLLSLFSRRCDVPILSAYADSTNLCPLGKQMLQTGRFASDVYTSAITDKFGSLHKPESSQGILKL